MNPSVLSTPKIEQPIYRGARAVAFYGHLAVSGVEVEICRIKPDNTTDKGIASAKNPLQHAETVVLKNTYIDLLDRVYAVQKFNQIESPVPFVSFDQVIEPPRASDNEHLPEPVIETPIYVCARGIWVRNILNGATVEIFVKNPKKKQGEKSVWKRPLGYPRCFIGIRPVEEGDEIRATQSLPDHPQKLSSGITGYSRAEKYKGRLPAPKIVEPLIECSTSFEVENTETGATIHIYDGKSEKPIAIEVASGYRTSIQLRLEVDMSLTADQMLCGEEDRSPRSQSVDVKKIESIKDYPPTLLSDVNPGTKNVIVKGLHESIISVYADGKEIGYGSSFGIDSLGLVETICDAEVELTQSIYCENNTKSASVKSKPVKSIPDGEVLLLEEETYTNVTSCVKLPMVVLYCHKKPGSFSTGDPCETAYFKLKEIAKEFSGQAIAAYADVFVGFKWLGIYTVPSYRFYMNGKIVFDDNGYTDLYNGFDIDHVKKKLNKLIQNP